MSNGEDMATKNFSTENLSFGIDRILSSEYSASTENTSTSSQYSMPYSCFENYKVTSYFPTNGGVPFFGQSEIIGSTSVINNFENIFSSQHNIIRPAPVRPTQKELVRASASSTSQIENSSGRRRSWSRAVFSSLQRKGLEKRFAVQKYITKPDRRQLAASLGLTDAQVKVWFQNRRMKWRHTKEAEKSASLQFSLNETKISSGEEDIDVGTDS